MEVSAMYKPQTYNDGICALYRIPKGIQFGDLCVDELEPLFPRLCYENRKVGYGRFFSGFEINAKITRVMRIPKVPGVDTLCAVVDAGTVYKIVQVQGVDNTSLDLSLEVIK